MQLHPLNNESGIPSPSATTMRYVIPIPLIHSTQRHYKNLYDGVNVGANIGIINIPLVVLPHSSRHERSPNTELEATLTFY